MAWRAAWLQLQQHAPTLTSETVALLSDMTLLPTTQAHMVTAQWLVRLHLHFAAVGSVESPNSRRWVYLVVGALPLFLLLLGLCNTQAAITVLAVVGSV